MKMLLIAIGSLCLFLTAETLTANPPKSILKKIPKEFVELEVNPRPRWKLFHTDDKDKALNAEITIYKPKDPAIKVRKQEPKKLKEMGKRLQLIEQGFQEQPPQKRGSAKMPAANQISPERWAEIVAAAKQMEKPK